MSAVIDGRGMGRRPAVDEQDKQYPMQALVQPVLLRPYRHYQVGPILDQGATGTCVGHAWRQWLSSALLMTKDGPDAFGIYLGACPRDPWPDNDGGDLQFGTSVRAGAKYLQEIGHIDRYLWAWQAATVRDWILSNNGGVVVGTDYYEGMLDPDPDGYIHPIGRWVGGHAYYLPGYSAKRDAFRMVNSWSRQWGQAGRAWLSFEALDRLLRDGGEACTAVERRRP